MSISSRVLSAPPRSARASEARTSFTPEKDGLPRTAIIVLAALVSASLRFADEAAFVRAFTAAAEAGGCSVHPIATDLRRVRLALLQACQQYTDPVIVCSRLELARAVRDTELNGVAVKKDDFIGFVGDTIYTACAERNQAAAELCDATSAEDYDIMLLVCGCDASAGEAQALYSELKKKYKWTEIVMIDGGQPVYDYIIILE